MSEPRPEPRFDDRTGPLPAVIQDARTGEVRMLGYMDREALDRTRRTGRVTFYSRSREELWEKGETSGNWLEARSVRVDCDGDALLVRAVPHGPTCHTGRQSCFGRSPLWRAEESEGAEEAARGDPSRRPETDTDGEDLGSVLERVRRAVVRRDRDRPAGSYTARLLDAGAEEAARKVAEEALEVTLAAAGGPDRIEEESADLLYHLLVLWQATGTRAGAVAAVLSARRDRDRRS